MSLFFEIDETVEVDQELNYEDQATLVLEGVLDYLKCPYECEMSVLITDDECIKEVNAEQRSIDKSTDVLSFPMVEWESICDFQQVEGDGTNFHPESGELMLGDVVISYDTMIRQAMEYGHGVTREYSFLLVHSLLHLFGHDHMEDGERVVMESEQAKIMELLGIDR